MVTNGLCFLYCLIAFLVGGWIGFSICALLSVGGDDK